MRSGNYEKTMMISHLPHDLESEILSRVPAKSLVKLKTTCKRWYALFRDPKFVKKNFGSNKSASEVIVLMNCKIYLMSVNLHGIHKSMGVTGKLRRVNDSKDMKVSQIFHCDGLILCSTWRSTRLVVWNPCTGQTRWIKPRTCFKCGDTYAMGYANSDSCGRGYKLLRFWYDDNDQELRVAEFEIYEFSTDSWRVLDELTHKWGIYSGGVSLKGDTYWVAAGEEEPGFFILHFDFTTETFGRFPLPFQSFNSEDTAALSVVGEDKISVLHQSLAFSNEMKIWVTNKIDEANHLSWSEFLLVVDFNQFHLPSVSDVISFLLDQENNVAICCSRDIFDGHRTKIDILGEDIHRQLYKDVIEGTHLNWPFLYSYVPNLVHIQKNTPKRQKKRKQNEA